MHVREEGNKDKGEGSQHLLVREGPLVIVARLHGALVRPSLEILNDQSVSRGWAENPHLPVALATRLAPD